MLETPEDMIVWGTAVEPLSENPDQHEQPVVAGASPVNFVSLSVQKAGRIRVGGVCRETADVLASGMEFSRPTVSALLHSQSPMYTLHKATK